MKKILYLCHRIPYPPNKGDKIRSFNEIKYLSKTHTIDLIALADDPRDLKYTKELKRFCRQVQVFHLKSKVAKTRGLLSLLSGQSISQGYFYNKSFQDVFDQWTTAENYDAIICFSSPMAEYIFKSKHYSSREGQKTMMDFCDLDSDKWLQYSKNKKFPANLVFKIEAARLLKFEKKINQTFDQSIFVSDKEADLFRSYFPESKNIRIIPNGVDHEFFNPDSVKLTKPFPSPMIMFSGAMDYYANIDGVSWFAEKMLSEIKIKIPKVKFYIVGNNPPPAVKALGNDSSIIVTGFVEDIREYYKAADLCVIPLRIARGVQNKVLEALSMEKKVISTSPAVQGIRADVSDVLEIEDDPLEFAKKSIAFLSESTKSLEGAKTARRFVIHHYDWENNLNHLSTFLK